MPLPDEEPRPDAWELAARNYLQTRDFFPRPIHEFPPAPHEESVHMAIASRLRDEFDVSIPRGEGICVPAPVLVHLGTTEPHLLTKLARASGPMEGTLGKTGQAMISKPMQSSEEDTEAGEMELEPPSFASIRPTLDKMPRDLLKDKAVPSSNGYLGPGKSTEGAVMIPFRARRGALPHELPDATPHPKWKLMRVISGHIGWVRSLAVDMTNDWFASGAGDRTIKIWDLASGTLRLTLTGHIAPVRGLAISERHPYLFSAGEDKQVKCWDLEQNKVVRHYHGHLQGIYALSLHPTLDLLVTAGRDAVARVWDVRTRAAVFTLAGHTSTIDSLATQAVHPQVITGSMDSTVKLWDLAAGRCFTTLTHHKKSVRALALHPREFTFACGGARDSLKKFLFPKGVFLHDFSPLRAQPASRDGSEGLPATGLTNPSRIINALAINQDGVMVSGSDAGYLEFYDFASGRAFQVLESPPQLGSLDSEAGIFCATFDKTGLRLITGEADKTIKVWRECTPEEEQEGEQVVRREH